MENADIQNTTIQFFQEKCYFLPYSLKEGYFLGHPVRLFDISNFTNRRVHSDMWMVLKFLKD